MRSNTILLGSRRLARTAIDLMSFLLFAGSVRSIHPHKKLRAIGAVQVTDPRNIKHYLCDTKFEREIKDQVKARIGPLQSHQVAPTTEMDIIWAYQDVFAHQANWQDTVYYQRVCVQINNGVKKFGCTHIGDFDERLEADMDHFNSIKQQGYKSQMALRTLKPWDEVQVIQRKDGSFLFVDGRHRLAAAQVLKVPEIPVLICGIEK
jgi:hypothetical protein